MSRLSFRPRPLDIYKKLPIVRSNKDFEDDDGVPAAASTRNSHLLRIAEVDTELPQNSIKKSGSVIPTPQFDAVDTYERDYLPTFMQPTSYLRGRGARGEIGEFVDYDLDDEDEDWLLEFYDEKRSLTPEKFETILFKLELLDHKTRERAGVITPTYGAPVPVLLELEPAAEALLQAQALRFAVFQSVYNYWKAKRERWQKPILRHLQPPPPVNDTNPYNVFRPREKVHRLNTRRMQRRENNVQSFEKLRQVRRSLEQSNTVFKGLIKREEKKREIIECEINLQRIQLKYKNEAELAEDGLAFSGLPSDSYRYGSSDEDYMDSDDTSNGHMRAQSAAVRQSPHMDSRMIGVRPDRMKQELQRRPPRPRGWLDTSDPDEPVMLFTKPLDLTRLAAAGITRPQDPPIENGSATAPYRFKGRMGRGGRIIFDRWNPLLQSHLGQETPPPVTPVVTPQNRMSNG